MESPHLTHEARRFCHGDDAWSSWQPCTMADALRRQGEEGFEVRPRVHAMPDTFTERDALHEAFNGGYPSRDDKSSPLSEA